MSPDEFQHERRKAQQEDHDLLVSHDVKLDQLAAIGTITNNKLDFFIEKIDARCDSRAVAFDNKCSSVKNNVDARVPNKIFYWMMGIMIGAMIMMSGYISICNNMAIQNKTNINSNSHEIDRVRDMINEIHKR